jgi:hypothetical protein
VETKWRKDVSELSGFKFVVDGEPSFGIPLGSDEWHTLRHPVAQGQHLFEWVFTKYQSEGNFLAAEIEYILIQGVQTHRVSQCPPCRQGFSNAG